MKTTQDIIRELREDKDLKQVDVAAILGITQQVYSKYENGRFKLPLHHFIALANYYNVSADYLIGRIKYDKKHGFQHAYVVKECSCDQLMENILTLSEHGRKAVIEYVKLQMIKEKLNC